MFTEPALSTKWLFITGVIVFVGIGFTQLFRLAFPVPVIAEVNVAKKISNSDSDNTINAKQLNSLVAFEQVKISPPDLANKIESKINNTHLNLILSGIAESSNESSARAVIIFESKENIYAAGDLLPGKNNVSLTKIMSDHVVINNDGQYELLWLYNSKVSTSLQEDLIEPSDASKDTSYFYGPPDGNNDNLTIHSIERDEELALTDINRNLLDIVTMSIQRIDSNRQLVGYKIRPGFDANKFKAAGLCMDDMITAINGIPLTKPNEILESYKNSDGAPISLEIERGDSVITVELNQTL